MARRPLRDVQPELPFTQPKQAAPPNVLRMDRKALPIPKVEPPNGIVLKVGQRWKLPGFGVVVIVGFEMVGDWWVVVEQEESIIGRRPIKISRPWFCDQYGHKELLGEREVVDANP